MNEENLFRLRVEYVKQGRLRYLGHLELIHTVERIVRRAQLPYAVTQGFSPHMKIAFSSALPVGTASDCEWYDVFLTAYVPAPRALEALVAASPADLAPRRAGYVDRRAAALTAALTRARYRAVLALEEGAPSDEGRARDALVALCAADGIPYLRGKKTKTMSLARTLVSAGLVVRDALTWELALDTRSSAEGALRPEVLIRAWEKALAAANGGAAPRDAVAAVLAEPLAVAPYGIFAHCEIARISQNIEDKRGILVEPLPLGA